MSAEWNNIRFPKSLFSDNRKNESLNIRMSVVRSYCLAEAYVQYSTYIQYTEVSQEDRFFTTHARSYTVYFIKLLEAASALHDA